MKQQRTFEISKQNEGYGIFFRAMASSCEALIQSENKNVVTQLAKIITEEVWRIEDKYSRYKHDSICSQINASAGNSIDIDEETYLLLNFAEQCYQLSDGLFDISSGVLRKIWHFDSHSGECRHFPKQQEVSALLCHVGWHKVYYDQNHLTLPAHMELDFGGIGKEYAVDRCILLVKQLTDIPVLVNLGGDIAVTGSRIGNNAWQVAIEHPDSSNTGDQQLHQHTVNAHKQTMIIALKQGALATSGNSKRFLMKAGIKYGHVLNAKTGWPITQAPRSITTVAPQCITAGILATLALLQGKGAETFLIEQEITHWLRR